MARGHLSKDMRVSIGTICVLGGRSCTHAQMWGKHSVFKEQQGNPVWLEWSGMSEVGWDRK